MADFHTLLAAGQNLTEVLFGIVFVLIWLASAAMSQMAKHREKQRLEQVRRQAETGRIAPPPLPTTRQQHQPRPIQRTMTPRPQASRPTARRSTQAPKRPVIQRAPVPLEAMMRAPAAAPPPPIESKSQPAATSMRRPTSATAASLHAWLKPATLRQQFLLTELFQPPLTLRDPDASRLI